MPTLVATGITFTIKTVDGTDATLHFQAETLDRYIAELVLARSLLAPEHPPKWPSGQTVQGIIDPAWTTELDMGSMGSILHVRHPGLGWLHFLFPRHEAAHLVSLLTAQIGVPTFQGGPAN